MPSTVVFMCSAQVRHKVALPVRHLSKSADPFDLVARSPSAADERLLLDVDAFATQVFYFHVGTEQEILASKVNDKLCSSAN